MGAMGALQGVLRQGVLRGAIRAAAIICAVGAITAAGSTAAAAAEAANNGVGAQIGGDKMVDLGMDANALYNVDSRISEVKKDPIMLPWGRLIFPAQSGYMSGSHLGDIQLTWYNHIDPKMTVEIVNYLKIKTLEGEQVFFPIYREEEQKNDPRKRDTGIFFFRAQTNSDSNSNSKEPQPFAICNAGGAFAYVGAIHDSMPHAMEISKRGLNAFALIYRPGARNACEDLARAISVIFANAKELGVSTENYSLWGGSAGARMAAWVGRYGPAAFGGDNLPNAATVVMQYTGLDEYSEADPPTYANCGEDDWIADWEGMQYRLEGMSSLGIPTEFHHYKGLPHGFGLGTGTVAEDWIDEAVAFWRKNVNYLRSYDRGLRD